MTAVITLAVLVGLFALTLTPPGRSLRRWAMARLYDRVMSRFEIHAAERKRALFAELSGTVVEIGPGTGANFQHLPDGLQRWIGIEPNPHMHPRLRASAARRNIEADFRNLSAEGMGVEDESVDAVLSTFVLCSVPDPAAVLGNVRRILVPGGRFVFMEHVAAPSGSRLRRLQGLAGPFWKYMADGCCLDRELGDAIRGAGFREVRLEGFVTPRETLPVVVSNLVAGVATK